MPWVCIVTPVLNGERYLDETIASVLGQGGDFVLHYHIQDGGSTDRTLSIVRRWRWRHRLGLLSRSCAAVVFTASSERDRGMYQAVNRGFGTALPAGRGGMMGWIAADDKLAPGALATVTDLRRRYPDVQLMGGRSSLLDERGSIVGVAPAHAYSQVAMAAGIYDGRKAGFVLQEGTFWTSGLWHDVGGLDPTFELAGDWDLWRRFAEHAPYVAVDSVLGLHRRRTDQLSADLGRYHRDVDAALKRFGEAAQDRYRQAAEDFDRRQAGWAQFRDGKHAGDCLRYDLERREWRRIRAFGAPLAPTRLLTLALGVRLAITPTNGFGPFNAADAAFGLFDEVRWIDQERASGSAFVPGSGRYRMVLRCRCFLRGQRLTLRVDDRHLAIVELESFGHDRENEIALDVVLSAGTHHFSIVSNRPEDREPYLLVVAWTIEGSDARPALGSDPTSDGRSLPAAAPPKPSFAATWPRISVVVPTFNHAHFIGETLSSLVRQNYPDLELIVVDGASTDETMLVLREFLPFISKLIREPDSGQSEAINKGFAAATGTIMSWLNSDDLLADGALFAVAQAFVTSTADMVVGICEVFGEDGKIVHRHLPCFPGDLLPLDHLLDLENHWLAGEFFYQPEVFFTRDIWDRAGGRVDETLFYSMDYDLWVRMAEAAATIQVIGHPVARFRSHAAQKTSSLSAYLPELSAHAAGLRRTGGAGDLPPSRPVRPKLRILFFNDYGYRYGAGIAHRRLAQATALLGHDVVAIAYADFDGGRPTDGPSARQVAAIIADERPDLVIVGNLHSVGADFDLLGELATLEIPAIFYAHDEWIMTGRCAYRGPCRKHRDRCDAACPTALAYPALPPTRISDAFAIKREALVRLARRGKAAVLTNSLAMTNLIGAEIEVGLRPPVLLAHYGIDTTVFGPGDRWRARDLLGIRQDAFVIMTAAAGLDDERKGLRLLLGALVTMSERSELMLVIAGFGRPLADDLPFAVHQTGFIEDESVIALYHRAADIFVGPSLEEAFGQTFLEAAACGIPAVAFAVGGIQDVAVDRVTGIIATEPSASALAAAIALLRASPDLRRQLGAQAAIHARNRFSIEASAARLQAIFAHDDTLSLGAAPNAVMSAHPVAAPAIRYLAGSSDHSLPGRSAWTPLTGIVRDSDDVAHDHGLTRCWRTSRNASLLVSAEAGGFHAITLAGRSSVAEQMLNWAFNRGARHSTRLFLGPDGHPDHIELVAELEKGPNRLDLDFEEALGDVDEQRDFAFLIETVTATREAPVSRK